MTTPKEAAKYLAQLSGVGGRDGELPELRVVTMKDVTAKEVRWLWPKRIPRGKFSVIAGDPGLAKSYMSLDIAARLSLGGPWPNDEGNAPQGNVLLISAEDGLEDTIRPRLDLLGADLSKIHAISTTVRQGDKEVSLSLVDHLRELETVVVEREADLLVLDPILAFTGSRTNTYKSSEVRAVLAPLAAMGEVTGCAILAIMHLNKQSGEFNSIYRLTSSLDFAAAARSVQVVGKEPDDPTRLVLAPVKMNLSAPPLSLGYHFTDAGIFTWHGTVPFDAAAILGAPPVDTSERDEAKTFLMEHLANGAKPSLEVIAEAREYDIAEKTLRRAFRELGGDAARMGEPGKIGGGKWTWRLPKSVSID